MAGDISKEILVGALMWLRNHYDVGIAPKEEVLARVDKVLLDADPKIAYAAAFREAYPIEDLRKRKRPLSWRTCPECGSRATKMFSLNTGKYTCQVCDCEYENPREQR